MPVAAKSSHEFMSIPLNLKLLFGREKCLLWDDPKYPNDMYRSPSEIVALIKAALMEASGRKITSVRTIESGIVEEYAVVSHTPKEKQLLLRLWPVFFTPEKRVEYQIITSQKNLSELIYRYLSLLAKSSGARLVEKN